MAGRAGCRNRDAAVGAQRSGSVFSVRWSRKAPQSKRVQCAASAARSIRRSCSRRRHGTGRAHAAQSTVNGLVETAAAALPGSRLPPAPESAPSRHAAKKPRRAAKRAATRKTRRNKRSAKRRRDGSRSIAPARAGRAMTPRRALSGAFGTAERPAARRAALPARGPRARRRRAAGRHLRGRRAAGARRFARRDRSQRPRRLRRRVVGRLRRRRAGQRHLAGADVPAVHRRRRRSRAYAGAVPASRDRRIRAPRAVGPGLLRPPARDYLRDPFRRGAVGSRSPRWGARCRPACSTSARSTRFSRACSRPRAAPTIFGKLGTQAVSGRDQSRHRRVGDFRQGRASITCRSQGDRGVGRAARPVSAGGDRRRALRRRRAQQDAARVGRARRGRRSLALRQSAGALRRELGRARRPPHRREASIRAGCRWCWRRHFARSSIRA